MHWTEYLALWAIVLTPSAFVLLMFLSAIAGMNNCEPSFLGIIGVACP